MIRSAMMPVCAVLLTAGWPCPAWAQAAAETAVILSGTGQATGAGARSLGSAVSGAIGSAAAQVHASRNAHPQPAAAMQPAGQGGQAIAGNVDMLAGTDAPTYRLGNGSAIRVSGTLRHDTATPCTANCPTVPARRKRVP